MFSFSFFCLFLFVLFFVCFCLLSLGFFCIIYVARRQYPTPSRSSLEGQGPDAHCVFRHMEIPISYALIGCFQEKISIQQHNNVLLNAGAPRDLLKESGQTSNPTGVSTFL